MAELTVHIVECPLYSYKLSAIGIHQFYDQALKNAKNLYLDLYENAYKDLMTASFNPLWTPDTKSENDLDFKDDFGRVSYFYFNISLLNLLTEIYELNVLDTTTSEFTDQFFIYDFLKEKDISFYALHKTTERFAKHKIKRFIFELPGKMIKSFESKIKEIKDIIHLQRENFTIHNNGPLIYIYVHSVGNMSLKSYLNWRYSDLLEALQYEEYSVVILSTIDFDDSESIKYPFVNINRLVNKTDLLKSLFKSIWVRLNVIGYVVRRLGFSRQTIEKKYFLKNFPTHFFYPIRELYGFDRLFKGSGPGLLTLNGPVNNKGASSLIFKARQNGIRLLLMASRILTSVRFSNQFIDTHQSNHDYPDIFPHALVVYDRISLNTMRKQLKETKFYTSPTDISARPKMSVKSPGMLTVCLVLQKKKEIKEMVREVLNGIQGLDNIILKLKMHPTFPIPEHLLGEYKKIQNVQILPQDTSLKDSIQSSDVCVTSYSTAALEFAKNGKPIIWIKNATLNSLFLSELQKVIGISVYDSAQLHKILKKMRDESDFYLKMCNNHHSQIHQVLFRSDDENAMPLRQILKEELQKV